MQKQLRERLEELHAELASTESVDDRSRELIARVLDDVQALLDRAEPAAEDEPEGLVDRLRDATRHFEESHPTLAAAVGRVVDALSNLGI
jgi:predicted component of type VI protein secretion system